MKKSYTIYTTSIPSFMTVILRNLVVTVKSRLGRQTDEVKYRLKLKYLAVITQAFCDLSIVINSQTTSHSLTAFYNSFSYGGRYQVLNLNTIISCVVSRMNARVSTIARYVHIYISCHTLNTLYVFTNDFRIWAEHANTYNSRIHVSQFNPRIYFLKFSYCVSRMSARRPSDNEIVTDPYPQNTF